jgi:prevent-host-death family protein
MKILSLEQTDLNAAVKDAQDERVVITQNGKPIAIILSTVDWDEEQLQLAQSDSFWQLIAKRRNQKTISRAELERRLATG